MVRPTEPPPGLASIVGAWRRQGAQVSAWDANLEGLLYLLGRPPRDHSVWSTQAERKREAHLAGIRSGTAFRKFDAYKRALRDFCRLLNQSQAVTEDWFVSLTDCEHLTRKPYRIEDLHWAFANPDANPFFPHFSRRLSEWIAQENPEVIGFSMNYLSQALTTFAMAGHLRREHPRLRLMLGGSLTACWLANYPGVERQFSQFDGLFHEPGEGLLPEFLPRAAVREEGDPSPFAPPDFSPFPWGDYLSPGPIVPISLSRGCYWKTCAFCAEHAENRSYQAVPSGRLIGLLRELEERWHPVLFHFADSSLPPNLLKTLANNPIATPWYGFVRFVDEFLDPDFCMRLRAAGCVMLQLGLESGNAEVLRGMNKGITPENAAIALRNLKAAGIGTFVYILFGTPFENQAKALDTRDFLVRHHADIDFLNLAIFSLPIGVPEAARLETRPFSNGDLHLYYEFSHPEKWDRNDVRRFLEQDVKMHPQIRPIVLREPPSFTSNHAPFFLAPPLG